MPFNDGKGYEYQKWYVYGSPKLLVTHTIFIILRHLLNIPLLIQIRSKLFSVNIFSDDNTILIQQIVLEAFIKAISLIKF